MKANLIELMIPSCWSVDLSNFLLIPSVFWPTSFQISLSYAQAKVGDMVHGHRATTLCIEFLCARTQNAFTDFIQT